LVLGFNDIGAVAETINIYRHELLAYHLFRLSLLLDPLAYQTEQAGASYFYICNNDKHATAT